MIRHGPLVQDAEDAWHELLVTCVGMDPSLNSQERRPWTNGGAHLLISRLSQLEMRVQLGGHLEASCRVCRTAHETCYAAQAASAKPGAAQHAHGRLTGCAVQHWMGCCGPPDCVQHNCQAVAAAGPGHLVLAQAGDLWRQKEPIPCLTACWLRLCNDATGSHAGDSACRLGALSAMLIDGRKSAAWEQPSSAALHKRETGCCSHASVSSICCTSLAMLASASTEPPPSR